MDAAQRDTVLEIFHERYPEAAKEIDNFFAFCYTKQNTVAFQGLESGKTAVIT